MRDLMNIFIPREDTIYYRPISIQLFYFLLAKLFGLKIFYYHFVQIGLHATNGVLFYLLSKKIFSHEKPAFLAAFLFVTSWTHFYELTWIASTFNSIALLFILAYILSAARPLRVWPEIFLVLALLSAETAVVAPFLLLLFWLFFRRLDSRAAKKIILHLSIVATYLILRFLVFEIPTRDTYALSFSLQSIKNAVIFIFWLIGFSEFATIHLTRRNFPFTDFSFTGLYPNYSLIISMILVWLLISIVMVLAVKRKVFMEKIFIFGVVWFVMAILPIIIIPNRIYPYYPFIAQLGFWLSFVILYWNFHRTILANLFLIYFVIANVATVFSVSHNHWIFTESAEAKKYYDEFMKIKNKIPGVRNHILIRVSFPPAQQALSQGRAFNVFADNYQTKFYLTEDSVPPEFAKITCSLQVPEEVPKIKVKQDLTYWRNLCVHTGFQSCYCPPGL